MTAMRVRAAVPGDAAAIAALAGELGYPTDTVTASARLAALAGNAAAAVLVAEADGDVVAWMQLAVVQTLDSDAFVEIAGLVVAAAARSLGVGARLVEAAAAWARERGVGTLRVRSNVVRERAHRFYERQGFRVAKSQRVFVRAL